MAIDRLYSANDGFWLIIKQIIYVIDHNAIYHQNKYGHSDMQDDICGATYVVQIWDILDFFNNDGDMNKQCIIIVCQ